MIVPVCATYPFVESHLTAQLVSELVVNWMPEEQPSVSLATSPVPNEYAAHLLSVHTSAAPPLSLVKPVAHAETRLSDDEVHVYVAPEAAFVTAVQAVPAHVVAPSEHSSVCVLPSPSSHLLPPHPACETQEELPATPE